MTAAAFLTQNATPSEEDIVNACMGNNYCRCGCYARIKRAVTPYAILNGLPFPNRRLLYERWKIRKAEIQNQKSKRRWRISRRGFLIVLV